MANLDAVGVEEGEEERGGVDVEGFENREGPAGGSEAEEEGFGG